MKEKKKRFYFGYDAKKRRVFCVVFSASDAELPDRMTMFKESRLTPIEIDNNSMNRAALRKMSDAMKVTK